VGRFPELTPVQRAFPNPLLRASDITPPLGKVSLPLLRSEGYGFGPSVLLPLQLSNNICRVGGLEATLRESEAFLDELEFSGKHVLLLNELAQGVVVLTVAREVGDETIVVSGDRGILKLLKVGGMPDEHVMIPGG